MKLRGLPGRHRSVLDPCCSTLSENGSKAADTLIKRCNGLSDRELNARELISESKSRLVVWSAADEQATKRLIRLYDEHFKSHSKELTDRQFDDLVFTLCVRRRTLSWRSHVVLNKPSGLTELSTLLTKPRKPTDGRVLAFVFTGQGAQSAGMGLRLCHFDFYARSLNGSDFILKELGCPWSLMVMLSLFCAKSVAHSIFR